MIEKLNMASFKNVLSERPRDANKGMFGHVLVIGSDKGFLGATQMAAISALRIGAGLASIATRVEHASLLLYPEIMMHGVSSPKDLKPLLARASVIVLGPGLGQSSWSKHLWKIAIKAKQPLVVDADALNLLSKKPHKNSHWILTPHVGEAARLLKTSPEDIQRNRENAVEALQKKFGGIAILKGHHTLIADENQIARCDAGNPGMSTGGTGDILSGVIGGLLAQGLPLLTAAKMGVFVHATAGDLAAKNGGERGMIATDLIPFLRQIINAF